MSSEGKRAGNALSLFILSAIVLLVIMAVLLISIVAGRARDNGQWAQSAPDIKQWFNGLQSGKGLCCSFADGLSVEDPDWRHTPAGGYQVYYQGQWLDVPPEAVVGGGNRVGHAILWPSPLDPKSIIRCFLPGAEG